MSISSGGFMRRFPSVGLRIAKSSVSVMICLMIAYWLKQPVPIFACMAAIIVTRETVELSFKQGVARILSTVVGCLFALAIMHFNIESEYLHILVTGLGCALTIYFCVLIKHPDAASLSAVIFLSLALTHAEDKYVFAMTRMVETLSGIVIALGVNALIKNKKTKD